MNRTSHFLCSVVLGLVCASVVSAQADRYLYEDGPNTSPAGEPGQVPGPPYQPEQLSSWILYPKSPGCCDTGVSGPIEGEVYLRVGPSIPIGSGQLNGRLNVGWAIQGGARSLFFNAEATDAWTVDVGVININNNITTNPNPITLENITITDPFGNPQVIPFFDVTLNGLNRTFVTLGVGREHYLWGGAEANCDGGRYWRWGWDVGGRYGTGKLTFNELTHTEDVMSGFFFAVHSDLEIPCGACIFQMGFRTEYGYTWSDIMQPQNNAETQELNLMFMLGVRF